MYRKRRIRELEKLKSLLQTGLNVDPNSFKIKPFHEPAICAAVRHNDIGLLSLLLKYGVDVNTRDVLEDTAFDVSIIYGNNFLQEYLLQEGANPNIKDSLDNTSLDKAVLFNDTHAIKSLIKYNACVDVAMATKIIKETWFNLQKEYYPYIKTVLLVLKKCNESLYNNRDLRFMILSHLPEYHCHKGLYKKLQDGKHELKPFALCLLDGHTETVQRIVQTKNKDNKDILELLPSITSLYEKLLNDSAELKDKYPNISSIQKDSSALEILKTYAFQFKYRSLISPDIILKL